MAPLPAWLAGSPVGGQRALRTAARNPGFQDSMAAPPDVATYSLMLHLPRLLRLQPTRPANSLPTPFPGNQGDAKLYVNVSRYK
jgi:hypothetical protein